MSGDNEVVGIGVWRGRIDELLLAADYIMTGGNHQIILSEKELKLIAAAVGRSMENGAQ
jgi:hypothetical protein